MATYVQTYPFTTGTTAEGTEVSAEIAALGASVNSIVDAQIATGANIAIAKTALGTFTDWTAFTPTVTGSTIAGSGTYTTRVGRYCQIGKVIHFMMTVVLTAHTGTGDMKVGNLPTASSSTANVNWQFPVTLTGATFPATSNYMVAFLAPGLTYMNILGTKDGAGNANLDLNEVADNTATSIYISGFYGID